MSYNEGYDSGASFRDMEERGWDPGNTYLALMFNHKDDIEWCLGFDHGVSGQERRS